MTKQDFLFESEGTKCAGNMYLPETEEKRPVIVMAHGLGCIKEMRLDAFAEAFCNAGYACLAFDYRYFGESEGEPRQLLDIESQIKDWKAAISYARSCDKVDGEKIILWGSSFSGGHVLRVAAKDNKISAVISQCPFTDGIASSRTTNIVSLMKLGILAAWDLVLSKMGGSPVYVKSAGKPWEAALMTAPDCEDGYLALVPESAKGRFQNKVAARVVFHMLFCAPGKSVKNIKCPVLFCICDRDTVAPAKKTLQYAKLADKGVIKQYPVRHFDIYVGDAFNDAIIDQLGFLQTEIPLRTEISNINS